MWANFAGLIGRDTGARLRAGATSFIGYSCSGVRITALQVVEKAGDQSHS
jgi:hypothetical protein